MQLTIDPCSINICTKPILWVRGVRGRKLYDADAQFMAVLCSAFVKIYPAEEFKVNF